MADVLVTGASGGLGRRVVPLLVAEGWTVRGLSRRPRDDDELAWYRGDTVRGTGLDAAVAGADAVLHLAGGARGDDVAARHVSAAAARAGVRHLILISVVGADRMPIGYFRAKAVAERAVAEGGTPWSVLRAAQFHGFVERAVRVLTAAPIALAPRDLRFEPVDPDEVAARLAAALRDGPGGRLPDLAGPAVLTAEQLVGSWLETQGRRRPVWRPGLPGAVGAAYREGRNLAAAGAQRGSRTWADHFARRQGPALQ